jgi:hypothetical protein
LPEVSLSPSQQRSIALTLPSSAPGTVATSSRRLWPIFGAIAALLLIAVSAHFLGRRQTPEIAHVRQASPEAAPATIAQVDIPLLPLPPPPDDATTLLVRGQHAGVNPTTDESIPAFSAYNRGNYALAAERFSALAEAYPRSDLVSLYKGVSQLFLRQDQAALATLQLARQSTMPSVADSAQWYSAIAANRAHSDALVPLLDSLCKNPKSQYTDQSCSILSKLR